MEQPQQNQNINPQQNSNNFTKSQQMSEDNPLKSYFRNFSTWMSLPSKEMGYYPKTIVEMNEDNEIGIMPMTGSDEIMLKNPDALLNGEAMKAVLKSCCPAIKDPDHLMLNDVEALMVAIRMVSYGKEMEMEAKCPECKKTNNISLNLEEVLQDMSYMNEDYSVVINHNVDGNQDDVLRIHFVPYMYKSYLKLQKQTFEEEKVIRMMERMASKGEDLDESVQIKKMSESYSRIANLNFQMMAECVFKITSESDESFKVTNLKHIHEFIANISRGNAKKILDALESTMDVGVRHEYDVQCEHCEHTWKERMLFDPASFF